MIGPGSLTFRGNDLRRALLVASAAVASFAFRVVGAAGEFLLVEVFVLVSGIVFVVEVLILVVVEVLVVGLIRQVVLIDFILVVEVLFVVETVVRLV